jgi:glycosyltransferase involved in cell wall biosynthesis
LDLQKRILLFCSARRDVVDKTIKVVEKEYGAGEILYAGPAGSPFAKSEGEKFLSWGDGFFSIGKAISLWPSVKKINPNVVFIPLNNNDGRGYDLLKLFARFVSPKVVAVRPDGSVRDVDESLASIVLKPEERFYSIILFFMELASPILRKIFIAKAIITEPVKPSTQIAFEPINDLGKNMTDDPAPAISIIIRTFNEEKFLKKTLTKVFAQKESDKEVIVIDSGSTDGTVDIARSFPARVYAIRKEDFSYGSALNLGAKLARGEIVVNLSAHAIPDGDDWLKNLVAPLDDPETAGVHGRELPIEGHAGLFERKILFDAYGDNEIVRKSDPFFSNANSAIPKKLLGKFPFDETLGWAEDQLWASKVQEAGYKTVYTPDAPVRHSHNLDMRGNFDRALAYYRMLFATVYNGRGNEIRSSYRRILPSRSKDFRRFLVANRLMNVFAAIFYAPYCEYINYLGCDAAYRSRRASNGVT